MSDMSPEPELHDVGVPVMVMRGGTSKGLCFLASDLPADRADRDALLLSVMGSPDPRQIDGLGGAHPLTSKVAVVGGAKSRDKLVEVAGMNRAAVFSALDPGKS